MRITLLDRLTMASSVALANAGLDAERRRREDELIAALTAAVSVRDAVRQERTAAA